MDITKIWHGFISLIGIALFTIFGVTQYLNHTGFCYAENRYLSERELVDRALFKSRAGSMSFDEKVEAAKTRGYPTGVGEIEYPACCRAYPDNDSIKIFGYYRYQIGYYFAMTDEYAQNHEPNYPHKTGSLSVDTCGYNSRGNYSTTKSQNNYDSAIARNRKYWQEKGK